MIGKCEVFGSLFIRETLLVFFAMLSSSLDLMAVLLLSVIVKNPGRDLFISLPMDRKFFTRRKGARAPVDEITIKSNSRSSFIFP